MPQVGRVLSALEPVANSTVVVLASDHGWKLGHYGDHWGKHTLLAADTHVPLLISAPGFRAKRVHAPVELIDIYPTLLELCDVAGPLASEEQPALEGRSLVPLMRRRTTRRRVASSIAFSQWPITKPSRCMGYAVRTQGWTLIQWTADRRQRGLMVLEEAAECERHVDLFRVDSRRNASSRAGLLREELTAADEHPFVLNRLRRRLAQAMRLPQIRGPD